MALIKGEDYIIVKHWSCPNCHTHYDGDFKVGKYNPQRDDGFFSNGYSRVLSKDLFCARKCALAFSLDAVNDLRLDDPEAKVKA